MMSVTKNHLIEVMRQMLDSDREDAGLPPIGGAGVPYQSYVAKLDFYEQSVTATVLQNDLEEDFVWTSEDAGFTLPKEYVTILPAGVVPEQVAVFNSSLGHDADDRYVLVRVYVKQVGQDVTVRVFAIGTGTTEGIFLVGEMCVEIRIYPPTA